MSKQPCPQCVNGELESKAAMLLLPRASTCPSLDIIALAGGSATIVSPTDT